MDTQQSVVPPPSAAPAPTRPTAVTVVMVVMWVVAILTLIGSLLSLIALSVAESTFLDAAGGFFGTAAFSKTSYTIQYILNIVVSGLYIYALIGMRKRSLRAFYIAIGLLGFNVLYSIWPFFSVLGLIISLVLLFFLWREKKYFAAA